jgi:hypothetical protein
MWQYQGSRAPVPRHCFTAEDEMMLLSPSFHPSNVFNCFAWVRLRDFARLMTLKVAREFSLPLAGPFIM